MLNYISAELYKVRHRKTPGMLLFLLLGGETLYLFLFIHQEFGQRMEYFITMFVLGLPLALMLSSLVCSDLISSGGLKNELSFGLSPIKIYLGKLLSSLLVALAVLALVVGYYLAVGWLVYQHSDPQRDCLALLQVGTSLASILPLWVGALGLAHMLFFIVPGPSIAEVIYMCWLIFGDGLLGLIEWRGSTLGVGVMAGLHTLFLTPPFGELEHAVTWEVLCHNWLVGLIWVVGTSAVGIAVFRRQELR